MSRVKKLLKKVDKTIRVSGCPHYFGYLGTPEAQEEAPIPEECLTCKYMLECKKKSSLV